MPVKLQPEYQHSIPQKAPKPVKLQPEYQHSIPQKVVDVAPLSGLPVSTFADLKPPGYFQPLPVCDNDRLLSAIEEIQNDLEADAEVRDISLRVLAGFRASNSVEALSQIALYDLSTTLRSKAVSTLADFDHESVFETVVLACSDVSRGVRAAAARGLFRLSFDRADAWVRIAQSNDIPSMRLAAVATIEAGLVERSLERLIHRNDNVAYEAFAMAALLIKAREVGMLITALAEHKEEHVRLAILQVFKVAGDSYSVDKLQGLIDQNVMTPEMSEKVQKVIEGMVEMTI